MAYERAGYTQDAGYQTKNLLANDDTVTTRKITLLAGAAYVAGEVLGKITTAVAVIFMVTSFSLAVLAHKKASTIMPASAPARSDGTPAPAPSPAPAPVQTPEKK